LSPFDNSAASITGMNVLRHSNFYPDGLLTKDTCSGDSIQKCRTALNLGSTELFNGGLKIGGPQLRGDWFSAATTST
jgi:hypothetical protein